MNKAGPSGDRHSNVTMRISGIGQRSCASAYWGGGGERDWGAVSPDFRLGSHKAAPLRSSPEAQ